MKWYRIVLHRNAEGGSWWTLVAANGRALAHSEQYAKLSGAQKAARSLQRDLSVATIEYGPEIPARLRT